MIGSLSGTTSNRTATAVISEAPGSLIGFYVNSTSSGTLVLTQGGAAAATTGGTAISGTITPAIGYHCFPAAIATRLYATIGATLDVTFFFAAGG